jgi:hypothetical protein
VRGVLYALLATAVGLALVGGGIFGLATSGGDDGNKTGSIKLETIVPANSPPEDCAQVAERDARFRTPHVLQFGADGHGTVQCMGDTVNFTIKIDALSSGGFYDIVLERGRREEEIGSFLAVGDLTVATATVGPEVDLSRYDFITVRKSDFGIQGSSEPGDEPPVEFRAAL